MQSICLVSVRPSVCSVVNVAAAADAMHGCCGRENPALRWRMFRPCRSKADTLVTARCYASTVLAIALCLSVCPSVRPPVCLSVTSRSSTKTVKRRITQTTPHDSTGTLVFGSQRSPRNSTGITPCGGAKYRWGGSKSATFDK